jgi:2'-5' RNA ligase
MTDQPRGLRCFLAANIGIDALRALDALAVSLHEEARSHSLRLRFVPTENIHLTLKFFGEVPEGTVPGIERELARILHAEPPIALELVGLGAFPNPRRARVLFVGLREFGASGTPRLSALQARIDLALEQIGFPREEKPFHPHLTVARAPGDSRLDVAAIVAAHEAVPVAQTVVRELVLYQSELRPSGARYIPLSRSPFHHVIHPSP